MSDAAFHCLKDWILAQLDGTKAEKRKATLKAYKYFYFTGR